MNDMTLAQVDSVKFNPFQPATGLNQATVDDIKTSILRNRDNGTKGLINGPLHGRRAGDCIEAAFGRHRIEAFRQLAVEDPFFNAIPMILEELTDDQMYDFMLVENLDRRDISLVEVGEIFHDWMTKNKKTSADAAQKFGKTEEYVRSAVRMLNLPADARQALQSGVITVTISRDLLNVKKLAGEEAVTKALDFITRDSGAFDRPQDAITHVLNDADNVVEIYSNTGWVTAKSIPAKYLAPVPPKIAAEMLDVDKADVARKLLLDKVLHTLSAGQSITGPEFQSFSADGLERLSVLANPPACTSCPFHAVVDGDHYCGMKGCADRKKDAWTKIEIDEKVKTIGIKLYVNEKEDGAKYQLSPRESADKKLFTERHADLRLVPTKMPVYSNFDGVPSNLMVVVVGETAKKRIKADGSSSAAAGSGSTTKGQSKAEAEKAEKERKKMELEHAIQHLEVEAVDRFEWEVASPLFATVLDNITSIALLNQILDRMMDGNLDADFPEDVEPDEVIEQAKKAKKADGLKEYRRMIMHHTIYNRLQFYSRREKYYKAEHSKQPVLAVAKIIQELAEEWNIKTGAAFTKTAEKYQADLDQAIKDLKAAPEMMTGVLWPINNQKSLSENIAQAASHYQKKFGCMPVLCLVNPNDISDKPEPQDGKEADASAAIMVRPYRPIVRGQIWIGFEDDKEFSK